MMKTLKSTTIMLLVSLLMGSGCSKDDLTPKTQKGANTLSCRIDGKVFTAKPMWVYGGGYYVQAHLIDNILTIHATGPNPFDDTMGSISFSLESPMLGKVYSFPEKTIKRLIPNCNTTIGSREDGIFYGYGPAYFKITYLSDKVVAGEFSFKGVDDENTKKEISITDGRFDILITSN